MLIKAVIVGWLAWMLALVLYGAAIAVLYWVTPSDLLSETPHSAGS